MTTEVATATPPAIDSERAPAPVYSSPRPSQATATTTPSKSIVLTPSSKVSAPTGASSPSDSSRIEQGPGSPKSKRNDQIPKIVVKKEPSSPEPPSRRRPPKLHLNEENSNGASSASAAPRTTGSTLTTMREVGMACLSPGFATQDPTMREQLQRSISVRDQQRSIIEARLQRHPKTAGAQKDGEPSSRGGTSQTPKRRPPNSLSIVPPPHRAFANERVVQSAPLNQSFTGRHQPPPSSHAPMLHNQQQVNRLPPISDVFASDRIDGVRTSRPAESSNRHYYPAPRPSQPSPNNSTFSRPREHRSAEEALAHMSGGREDLLPRIIHYGGHQPPTPPSPPSQPTPSKLNVNGAYTDPPHSAKRRRTARDDYERESENYMSGSRDSPETKRRKKEEFLALCERAWELFHS